MYERFYEFGLSDEVLHSISDMGFEEPTQIQKDLKSLPRYRKLPFLP
jgi:superfamily II DNA/RNA helicase